MSVSASFTAVGVTSPLFIQAQEGLTVTISGTFAATWQLQRSNNLIAWDIVDSGSSTKAILVPGSENKYQIYYRVRVAAYTSGTLSASLSVVADIPFGETSIADVSPDYAASKNIANIQALFDAGAKTVIVPKTSSALSWDSTITRPTKTTFINHADWTLTGGTRKRFMQGAAELLTPQTITSLTFASGACTATCANHGYVAGDYVAINWAVQSGYNGVFRVETVTTNTFTYWPDIAPHVTTATAETTSPAPSAIQVRLADEDCTFINYGTIDKDYASNTGGSDGVESMLVTYAYCNNPRIINYGKLADTEKYCVHMWCVRNPQIEGVEVQSHSDGIHMTGPITGGLITGTKGHTQDNLIGIGTGDYAAYHFSQGDITGLKVRNTIGDNAERTLIAYFGSSNYVMDIDNEGVSGSVQNYPSVNVFVDASVLPNGNLAVGLANIRSVRTSNGTAEVITFKPATCNHADIEGQSLSITKRTFLQLGSDGSTLGPYKSVVVHSPGHNINCTNTSHLVYWSDSLTVNSLTINDSYNDGSVPNTYVPNTLFIRGVYGQVVLNRPRSVQGRSLVETNTTATQISGGGQIIINDMQSPTPAFLVNKSDAATTTDFYFNGGRGAPLTNSTNGYFRSDIASGLIRCHANGFVFASTTNNIVKANSGTAEAYGWSISVDPTATLATTAGQYCRSTNAGSLKAGPAVSNAAQWVALGTGASGVNTVI